MRSIAILIALCLGCLAEPAKSETDPIFTARIAAENLKAAARALIEARGAKNRVAALSQTVRAYEDGLQTMRKGLRKAAIRERVLRLEFSARRDQLSRLLGVLQTIERAPTPLLLIHPTGPVGTARSGLMLSEVTPALHAQAEELRLQLEELLLLQALQISAEEDLRAGLSGVQQARVALSDAIGKRTDLPKRLMLDPHQLKILAQNSQTLTGFANGLSDLPFDDAPEDMPDFSAAKGNLTLPVQATLLRGFNEADAAGLRRPGVVLVARPLSLVTTPWSATVLYRGPLLDYGNVMILEPDAGYLLVLAGLDQVYGEVGEILAKGDPVGLLGGTDPAAEEFLIEASEGSGVTSKETLYIELRYDGQTLDPQEWFAKANR